MSRLSANKSIALPVLPPTARAPRHRESALETDLARTIRGQVRFSQHDRTLYASDASPYQVEPIGVVVPADIADVIEALSVCRSHRVAVLPRGGGTSLAGQCTGTAVVFDLSALCRKIVNVDPAQAICEVETGVVIDELNRHLLTAARGLFYAPDPATIAQAAIGGTIGNNAAGSRSIKYGRTSENLAGVDVLLASGERLWLEPGAGRNNAIAKRLASDVAGVVRRHAEQIRQRFAKTVRRNAGYGLDMILKQLDADVAVEDLDLSGLICGSEGTLAIVLGAKLKLRPIPKAVGLAVASFATLEDAINAVNPILTSMPSAVELLDDVVLRAAMGNPVCRPYVDLLPRATGGADPQAVLYVEYQGDSADDIAASFARLSEILPGIAIERYTDAAAMGKAWTLRKSGEALLHGLPGKRKPQTFVEDNAVPPANLPRFVREFKAICTRHGTEAAYWAHASVGVLHVRPMLDLHDDEDLRHLREIAVEVADLARDCGGVMSGEHGDGRIRGPLLERFYGPEIVAAFKEIKQIFDPANLLNPGNIVGAGPIESMTANLRSHVGGVAPAPGTPVDGSAQSHDHSAEHQNPHPALSRNTGRGKEPSSIETYFDFSDQGGFGHAAEQCNGAGFCRKTTGGAMCPSYRVTLDERHSTRGRGNALRDSIRGGLGGHSGDGKPQFNDRETMATLDLCLSCKACKTECPSNVDVAKMKSEYLAQSWCARGWPTLKAKAFGHIRKLNELASRKPELANAIAQWPPARRAINWLLGVAPQRSLPTFAASLHEWFDKPDRRSSAGMTALMEEIKIPGVNRPKVIVYADCFSTYNEPHVGQSAVRVLEALGYDVRLPQVACCGRAMISTGLLPDAIASADRALDVLEPFATDPSVRAIVVIEPSCLSAMTDDWLSLKLATPKDVRKKLAGKAMLVEDFVERYWEQHPFKPAPAADTPEVVLHGHCHQKALGSDETSAKLLRRLSGGKITVIQSGCCGMAGSFGYSADKYDVSMAIGELSVFPPIRAADKSAVVCAPGTSCRHQIHDGTGRTAVHPIELVERLLCKNADPENCPQMDTDEHR